MEILTLVDGTELQGRVMQFVDDRIIFVYLTGMTLVQGYTIFSDSENIATIHAMDHGTEHTYEGYTEITAINNEFGNCNITLRRVQSAS